MKLKKVEFSNYRELSTFFGTQHLELDKTCVLRFVLKEYQDGNLQ